MHLCMSLNGASDRIINADEQIPCDKMPQLPSAVRLPLSTRGFICECEAGRPPVIADLEPQRTAEKGLWS